MLHFTDRKNQTIEGEAGRFFAIPILVPTNPAACLPQVLPKWAEADKVLGGPIPNPGLLMLGGVQRELCRLLPRLYKACILSRHAQDDAKTAAARHRARPSNDGWVGGTQLDFF